MLRSFEIRLAVFVALASEVQSPLIKTSISKLMANHFNTLIRMQMLLRCSFSYLLFTVISCFFPKFCFTGKLFHLILQTKFTWLFFPKIRITDEDKEIPVGKNNLLLRGCIIRNTDWVEGMVVYAGV